LIDMVLQKYEHHLMSSHALVVTLQVPHSFHNGASYQVQQFLQVNYDNCIIHFYKSSYGVGNSLDVKLILHYPFPYLGTYHLHNGLNVHLSYTILYYLGMLKMLGWKYLAWFYSQCKHVYVPSPSMANELNEEGIDEGIRIWARGVNTEEFNPRHRDQEWRRSVGFED